MIRLTIVLTGLWLFCAACNKPSTRLNAPPHGQPQETSDLQGTFAYMNDNALLANMTVSDIHFHPHRPTLNTLGQERLRRLALLIEAYGGTIRFNTNVTDEELVQKRTDAILAFLAEAGVDTTGEILVQDYPGGRGMDAREVILIKLFEATYQPKGGSGTGQTSGAPQNP